MCIASAAPHEDRNRLLGNLLVYGLSMAIWSAIVCFLFFGLLLS